MANLGLGELLDFGSFNKKQTCTQIGRPIASGPKPSLDPLSVNGNFASPCTNPLRGKVRVARFGGFV